MPNLDLEITPITRGELIELLNEDLSREVMTITSYVNSSKLLGTIEGAPLAESLRTHADAELSHAMVLVAQIDSLGGQPVVTPAFIPVSDKVDELLEFDLSNEMASIWNYHVRVQQCEQLGEHKVADGIRAILAQEQEHLARLVRVLGDRLPAETRQLVA